MKILLVIAVLIVLLVIVIMSRPATFRYERSATFNAPAAKVFAQIYDLHAWKAWSPWAKMDPNSQETFTGPRGGTGASMHWAGNSKVGEGTMTITESRPNEFVRLRLEFQKPMAATHTAEFTITSTGQQSTLNWVMFGNNNFMGKAMTLFINCDKMIGGQFEQGLAEIKKIVES